MNRGTRAIASSLGGQAAFFLLGNAFTLLVGLPLQIFVARTIGAEGLGKFSLIEGVTGLVTGVLGFGLATTLVRFIPDLLQKRAFGSIRQLVRTGLVVMIASACFGYAAFLGAGRWMTSVWPELQDEWAAVTVMGLLIPISLVFAYFQQALRGFQEFRYVVIGSSFLQLTVKALLSVLLLTLGFRLLGYAWAVVAATAVGTAWMGVGVWNKIRELPRDDQDHGIGMKAEWRRYATIIYGGAMVGLLAIHLDRFMVGFFAGAGEVGILAVVKQLQGLPSVFLEVLLSVGAPMFAAAHARGDSGERQHLYNLTTDWVVRLSLPLLLFFAIFADPLLRLYGVQFAAEGKHALWILVLAQAFNFLAGPVGTVLNMGGLEAVMMRLSIYRTVLSAVGFAVLIPAFGLMGAVATIALVTIAQNAYAFRAANTRLGIRWGDPRYLRWLWPATAAIIAGVSMRAAIADHGAATLVADLVMLYVVFNGLSLLRGLHEDDRELLKHLPIVSAFIRR